MDKKLKVLQLGRTFSYGGTETVMLNLCDRLHNKINIDLCSSGGELEPLLDKYGIRSFNIPDIGKKNIIDIFKVIFKIRKLVNYEKYDIIHSHHRTLTILSRIAVLFTNVKVIHTAHYLSSKSKISKLLGDNIIAVGQCVKQNLIDNMGIDSKCIEVINNGIDINSETKEDLFKGLRDNNCTIIVSISRFSYEKGLDILIDSVKEVVRHDNNVRFVIVGDGEEKENLIKQCEAFNIKKYVDFVGFKSNVLDYIKSSDFVVSTSRTEGFPVVPLETFSQGKTIVATNVGGTKEIVINNETGLLVNSEDISQISSAIIKLIDDKDLRIKMENKAYNLVTENFSVDKMCDQYYEYYKSIINKAQIK